MHARVPVELKAPLEVEIRRIRFRSALRLYFPVVGICVGAAYVWLGWKGHGLLSLFGRLFGDSVSEGTVLAYVLSAVLAISAIGTFFLMRYIATKKLYQDFLYCRRCDAFDYDEVGQCPVCQQELKETEAFFFLEFEDERKILESFGLRETKKGPNQSPEPTAMSVTPPAAQKPRQP